MTTLISFSNMDSKAIGNTSLLLHLESFQDESMFLIVEPMKSHHQAILGRAKMQKHKCSIDWDKNTISVTYKGSRMSLPLVKQNNEPLVAPASALLRSYNQERQLFVKGTHDNEASTSSASKLQKPIPSLPKIEVQHSSQRAHTAFHIQTHQASKQRTKKIWIQKELFIA